MNRIARHLVTSLLFCLFALPVAAQQFSSLEERMSAAEFKAAGLDKLSPEELAALNNWLRGQRSLAPVSQPPAAFEDRRGLRDDYASEGAIVSRIVGEFRGWKGSSTKFTLENGQVWKSTDPSAQLAVKLTNPQVTITPGVMDAWFLQVEGYNAKVRVIRLK